MIGDILQPTHLIFILLVALIFLGPKRLPEAGRALGKGIRDFRGALSGITEETSFQMPPAPIVSQAPVPQAPIVTAAAAPVQPVTSPYAQPSTPSVEAAAAPAHNQPAAVLTSSVTPEGPQATGWVEIESTDPSDCAD